MKANRKFLSREDEAVSPVIAVILMVAITVVLAATVYVWVSGFGQSGSQAKSLSVSALPSGGIVTMTVVSMSPNFDWHHIKITAQGVSSGTYGIWVKAATCNSYMNSATWDGTSTSQLSAACAGAAGDTIRFGVSATPSSAVTLNFVDTQANSVMASVTMPSLTGLTATTPLISTCAAGTSIAFTTPLYSKTTADTAKLATADFTKSANPITTNNVAAGASSGTVAPAFIAAEKVGFTAASVYDIGGTVAATYAAGTPATYCLSA